MCIKMVKQEGLGACSKQRSAYQEWKNGSSWIQKKSFVKEMQPAPCIEAPNMGTQQMKMQPAHSNQFK